MEANDGLTPALVGTIKNIRENVDEWIIDMYVHDICYINWCRMLSIYIHAHEFKQKTYKHQTVQ